MAEWLRRWTRNPMGYSRAGSNPVHSGIFSLAGSNNGSESLWHCDIDTFVLENFPVYLLFVNAKPFYQKWGSNPRGHMSIGS